MLWYMQMLNHEHYGGVGMDALVSVRRRTHSGENGIVVWAEMPWQP